MKMKKNIGKKAMINTSKIILALQIFFVVAFFVFFYAFTPHLNYPKNNETINNTQIDFKFRNANVILIDDNENFTSPREVNIKERNASVIFNPGTYYWKAVGIFESPTRKFTIPSEVGLELKNSTLKNTGNVPANISEEDAKTGKSTGLVILDVQIEYPVNEKNKTIYKGEQNE